MRKQLYVVIMLFCLVKPYLISAQDINPNNFAKVNDVLPPSPNAAALGKYGGLQVGLSSGGLNKTIPLYTFNYRKMSIPVTLSYNTTGFKVDENASRVGYGWVLNSGGVITRSVAQAPDESAVRLTPPQTVGANWETYEFLRDATFQGGKDAQPDIFAFNFNGYTGKFVFDENKNIVQIAVSNLKIETDFSTAAVWNFKITTPDGIKYYFGGPNATEKTKKEQTCGKTYEWYEPTAWYLLRIENLQGDQINFIYENLNFEFWSGIVQSFIWANILNTGCLSSEIGSPSSTCPALPNNLCFNILKSQGVLLKEIQTTDGGKIEFKYIDRISYGDKLISQITVRNLNLAPKFIYDFEYTHTQNNLFPSVFDAGISRPFLSKLKESSPDNTINREHKFYYNDLNGLPVQRTMAQDHWGYFNGKMNSSLVQPHPDYFIQSHFPMATANREPDHNFSRKGLLSKIEYPTGGWDTVFYEANTYYGQKIIWPPPVTVNRVVSGSGLNTQVVSESSPFSIGISHHAILNFNVTNNSGTTPTHHNVGVIEIQEVNGPVIYTSNGINPGESLTLSNLWLSSGKSYVLRVKATGSIITTAASLTYKLPSYLSPFQNVELGGVRVAKVETHAGTGAAPEIKKYYYAKMTSLQISSAAAPQMPNYYKNFKTRIGCRGNQFDVWRMVYCEYTGLYSYSLSNINDYPSVANYETVIEGIGEDFEGGATEYSYHLQKDHPASLFNNYGDYLSGSPNSNQSRFSGKELVRKVYKKNELGNLITVKEIINKYKNDPRRQTSIYGYAVNQKYALLNQGMAVIEQMLESYDANTYTIGSNWEYIDTIIEKTYDLNGQNPIVNTTVFYYDNENHVQLTRTETKNSVGEIIRLSSKYPTDYTGLTASDIITLGVKNLQDKGVTNAVIEQSIYRSNGDGSNLRLLASTFSAYKLGNPELSEVYQIERSAALTNYLPTSVNAGGILMDSRYKRQVQFDIYDSKNNLLQQGMENNIRISYLWDYKQTYPIAEVRNATQSQVAYTGFEADGTGNWQIPSSLRNSNTSFTGNLSYAIPNGNITRTGLASGVSYIVSYWSTSGSAIVNGSTATAKLNRNGWYYYEHVLNNTTAITVSGSAVIDDLRLYPLNAQMQTYTYEPLIGVTSIQDANNLVTYYHYDSFGRLAYLKDNDNNILKKYCYNYAGQPEICGTDNPSWIFTGTTRCKPCPSNGNYTTDIIQNQEKDVNPNSSTYNQFRWIDAGVSSTCASPADWQNTTTAIRCKKNTSNQNTGEQEQEQRDVNPCSQTYNTVRWVVIGNNTVSCPLPSACNSSNCVGDGKKCVNGNCEMGSKIYTSVIKVGSKWECTYHYEWSDGSWSQNYNELSSTMCIGIIN